MVRVRFGTTFMGDKYQTEACKKWHFKFNEEECKNPGPIEFVTYNSQSVTRRRHGESKPKNIKIIIAMPI